MHITVWERCLMRARSAQSDAGGPNCAQLGPCLLQENVLIGSDLIPEKYKQALSVSGFSECPFLLPL